MRDGAPTEEWIKEKEGARLEIAMQGTEDRVLFTLDTSDEEDSLDHAIV